ncbi:MAG: HAMP domain-containing sensor histidine kinase [Fibrobacterota bacterium]
MSQEHDSATTLAALEFDSANHQPVPNTAWTNRFGSPSHPWQNLFVEEDRPTVVAMVAGKGGSAEVRIECGGPTSRVALQSVREGDKIRLWAIPVPPGPADRMGETLARERSLGEMRMRFLSLVSHEFRTPLTVILSSSELLEHYGSNWPHAKRQSHFLRIQSAVATMTTLLDNVAFLGRAESGRMENAPDAIGFASLVDSILEEFGPLRSATQTIKTEIVPENLSAQLDPRIAKAVFSNLISNALRFSPPFGTVTISVKCDGRKLVVAVDDQGSGIPSADLDRIWEPFERGSNSLGVPGSGLGLAIVQRCMELVGGSAAIGPNPLGAGTRSIATFPLETTQ